MRRSGTFVDIKAAITLQLIQQPPKLFPAAVRDKVVFASTQELTNYIPREHLPVDLGGTADWKWSYEPPAEENEVVKAVDDQQRVEFFDEIDKLNLEYEQGGDTSLSRHFSLA